MIKRTKLLFILRDLGFGGAERQLVELCAGIDQDRFSVTVALFFSGPGYEQELAQTGVKVCVLSTKARYKFQAVPRLVKFMKREPFDIVHTSLPIANFLGGLAARLSGKKCIIGSNRNASPFSWFDPFCVMDFLAFHLFCDHVVANSQAGGDVLNRAYRIGQDKVTVIVNGKDFSRFRDVKKERTSVRAEMAIPEDKKVVVTIGRVCRQKDHRTLVRAVDILIHQRKRKDLMFLIVGKFEENYQQVKRLIEDLSLTGQVRLLGIREDVDKVLAAADIFVLTSLWEGIANVLLEAMAAEVPVIASDIAANREVVRAEETGLLVPARDPGALADAIERLIKDENLARSLSQKASQDIGHRFSSSVCIREHETLYQTVLKPRGEI